MEPKTESSHCYRQIALTNELGYLSNHMVNGYFPYWGPGNPVFDENIKGITNPKILRFSKFFFLLKMMYQHVAEGVVEY